ncbi:TetR/AcrR family transcriptional regulator [Paenibacillus urinalis]|uniref:TetR/AcrR family transcriptional regulator n=2 Tax=Paenibacillus TaxID=44249 RepID=A0AAX3N1H0_9BACL|nr:MULTISPECIES: TetR/AcrR family transcriptional regulator [Paenibacillus]WDH82514.1 TetR/AcrR family transcriptional regulator [Paenibacillus urinalis]WDH98568.1 TetR/AcrR family transcriptional regulator [Paenibacillus urinalis]WDI02260.1 TetR/AcrR family transcriptional regulator [Paenibacillus urinalis]SDW89711.1 transcriptional regulator, TetR family [Paenibacillus sp. PDC88]
MGRSLETQQKLIRAAHVVIREKGIGGFTLEAVAKQAGVSKGGLLHHFPSKDALIEGILEEEMNQFERQLQQRYEHTEKKRGDLLRAYISLSSEPLDAQFGYFGLMAAVGINPTLLDLVKRKQNELNERLVQDANGSAEADLILMTLDGLLFNDLFQLNTLNSQRRSRMLRLLYALENMKLT